MRATKRQGAERSAPFSYLLIMFVITIAVATHSLDFDVGVGLRAPSNR
jgi:hypothetical protein